MPIHPTTLPNHYVLIAEFEGAPGVQPWRSEFHIEGQAGGVVPGPTSAIVTACGQYWIDNLRDDALLATMTLRNWTYGQQPFGIGQPIYSVPVGSTGVKVATYGSQSTQPVGREVVAFVKIGNAGGRFGKQFLRGFLDNADVEALVGGEWRVKTNPPAVVTPALFDAHSNAALAPFLNASSTPRLVVVHFSAKRWEAAQIVANAPFSSPAIALHYERPGVNKSTRKNKR